MKKTILLLGDITGRSRVALRMAAAVLEKQGHEVLMLPTALVSNTLSVGEHAALDTTQYMLSALDVWQRHGFAYDLLSIGYITGRTQALRLMDTADRARARGVPVLLDPILGDQGARYRSVSREQEAGMRLLMEHADLITPNLTEACLLSGMDYEAALHGAGIEDMLMLLSGGGKRSVVITSARTPQGGYAVAVYDRACGKGKLIPYEHVEGRCAGTGDLFGAMLMDGLVSGKPLFEAVQDAAGAVAREIIKDEDGMLPRV